MALLRRLFNFRASIGSFSQRGSITINSLAITVNGLPITIN